jgi:dTDP-glucose 4,6-dehydratase
MDKHKTILVTGGCGFIGSNFIKFLLEEIKNVQVVNLDKQTYAGQGKNLEHMGINDVRYKLIIGDIINKELVAKLFDEYNFDYVFNALSHEIVEQFPIDKTVGDHLLQTRAQQNIFYQRDQIPT